MKGIKLSKFEKDEIVDTALKISALWKEARSTLQKKEPFYPVNLRFVWADKEKLLTAILTALKI